MADADIHRVIVDAKDTYKELHIIDKNVNVSQNSTKNPSEGKESNKGNNLDIESDLENFSSSTTIEHDVKDHNLRRSKRLTKTNRISRLNSPVPSDYMKHCLKTECSGISHLPENNPETDGKWTISEPTDNRTTYLDQMRTSANTTTKFWTEDRHEEQ